MCNLNWNAVEALSVSGAALLAALAYHHQVEQSRVTLWRDMTKEFDHDLKRERAFCAADFKLHGRLDMANAQSIMDFFETVAYLYTHNRIDRELSKETFEYYFGGYFMASREALDVDRKDDPTFYQHCYGLARDWAVAEDFKDQESLQIFFAEEERFGERMGE
jgi:hypothetical protein